MKVYAQYFIDNGLEYRKNTLLQFGDSWKLLGNIVLANPGSSEVKNKIKNEEVFKIERFYKNYKKEIFSNQNWYSFVEDSTMLQIEKIFNGWYINPDDTIKLNGVIQLFNIFNLKNQDLEKAIKSISIPSTHLFSKDIEKEFCDRITYFGFSQAVLHNNQLCNIAKNIFFKSSDKIKSMYNNEFDKNSFYHPGFINRSYNNKGKFMQKYKRDILMPIKKSIQEINLNNTTK